MFPKHAKDYVRWSLRCQSESQFRTPSWGRLGLFWGIVGTLPTMSYPYNSASKNYESCRKFVQIRRRASAVFSTFSPWRDHDL
jgi:hypothetical protein